MSKVLYIIAQKNFRDEEFLVPKEMLESKGIEVDVASIKKGPCTGMLGAKVDADYSVENVKIEDYDAVIVCGGSGSPELAKHEAVLNIIRKAKRANKLIAAICLAGMVLAKAGVVEGKKMTVYKTPQSVDAIKKNGGIFTDKDIEVDGLLITANGPHAARMFGEKILDVLH